MPPSWLILTFFTPAYTKSRRHVTFDSHSSRYSDERCPLKAACSAFPASRLHFLFFSPNLSVGQMIRQLLHTRFLVLICALAVASGTGYAQNNRNARETAINHLRQHFSEFGLTQQDVAD